MTTKLDPTLNEVNTVNDVAVDAILKEIDPVDAIRFLRQFEHGSGDYMKDRDQWLDAMSFEDLTKEILRVQKDTKAAEYRQRTRRQV